MEYSEAIEQLEGGDLTCSEFFKKNGYDLAYAYTLLLSGSISESKSVLERLDSVRADWLKKIICIIEGGVEYPTYFQIRNFLEIDLTIFINSKRIDYVNSILKLADLFQSINAETYKFLARGLLKNNFPKECKIFLDKSIKSYYNDVELHFLCVEYYLYMKDTENAKKSLNTCIKINPSYYPAQKTLTLLNNQQ